MTPLAATPHLHPKHTPVKPTQKKTSVPRPTKQPPITSPTAIQSASPSAHAALTSPAPSTDWVVLAQLLRPQGRKGELLAELLTDIPEQFEAQPHVFLAPANFTGTAEDPTLRRIEVASFFLPVGKNQGRIVLDLTGIDSIEQAEQLAGLELILPREELLPLEEDANYVTDLIGCAVYNRQAEQDTHIGTVADLQFALTPDGSRRLEDAAPLLEVTGLNGEELLIPYAKHFLLTLDVPAKKIVMQLPEGLLEINQ